MADSAAGDAPYTVITADTHGGGSHAQYREYLDPKYREQFDAWRAKYKNPYRDLAPGDDRRLRNWDDEMRNSQQDEDGIAGEVIFPNTVPPFFPGFVLFAPPPNPETYELRHAGIQTHNRWLVDFCSRYPDRRKGLGQIFLNDIDDAIADIKWIKENGLAGVLIPPVPPDAHSFIRPLSDPEYDRIWSLCEDLDLSVNVHGGTGSPSYPKLPSSQILHLQEITFYSRRPLTWMLLSGVFERHPKLKFVITEIGCAWLKEYAAELDGIIKGVQSGQTGELRFAEGMAPPKLASEYIYNNVYVGVSMASTRDVAARDVVGPGHWMWGSDYPHDEGTYPFSKEHLRVSMAGLSVAEKRALLGENAAKLYGFDLEALAPVAANIGPSVAELESPLTSLPEGANGALRGVFAGRGAS